MKWTLIACAGLALSALSARAWALDPLGTFEDEARLKPSGRTVRLAPVVPSERDALATALAALRLRPADITFPTLCEKPDPHRRVLVERLLAHPHDLERAVLEIAREVQDARDLAHLLPPAYRMGDLVAPARTAAHGGPDLAGALARFVGKPFDATAVGTRVALARLEALPGPVRAALASLLDAHTRAADEMAATAARFSPPEVELLSAVLLGGDPEGDESQVQRLERVLALVARVDRARAPAVLGELALATEALTDALAVVPTDRLALVRSTRVPGARGAFFLGGMGPDRTSADDALVVDLGGDDVHERTAAGARRGFGTVHALVDLGGDDRYLARRCPLAAGFGGVGIVWDVRGDDAYDADSCALGAGVLGAGLLVDERGNDTYRVESRGEGYAQFGFGLLVDAAGADSYHARSLAQGCAHVGGVALLHDRSGHDIYSMNGGDKDFRGDALDSFGQGYAVGWRDVAAGGVGGLVDGAGNDAYGGDFWAQGVGYWYGLGFLVDHAGNDRYSAGRYAQGAGVHAALGCLLDRGGHDTYVATAVSQGTGYDESAGVLHDSTGNDVYVAHDFAQGRGFANGFGLLRDDRGSDAYFAWQSDAQGYATPHRGFGSVGVQLDLGGYDRYAPKGRNNTVLTRGDRGVLLDAPLNEGPR